MNQTRVLQEVIRSYSYVLTWMGISSSVILFNKWLLAYSGFPYPIALTLWHMFFCSTVGVLCVRVFRVVKSHNMSAKDYVRRVMPIGRQLRTCGYTSLHGGHKQGSTSSHLHYSSGGQCSGKQTAALAAAVGLANADGIAELLAAQAFCMQPACGCLIHLTCTCPCPSSR